MLLYFSLFMLTCVTSVISWYPSEYQRFRVPGEHSYHAVHNGLEHAKTFEDEWTVQVDGGEEIAQLVALELGYVYGGPVRGFPNVYTFLKFEHGKERRNPGAHTLTLAKDRRVRWAEPLFTKTRVKRYPTPGPDQTVHRVKRLGDDAGDTRDQTNMDRRRPLFNDELWEQEWYLVRWAEPLFTKTRVKRYPTPCPDQTVHRVKRLGDDAGDTRDQTNMDRRRPLFNDELWEQEWYLKDTRAIPNLPRLDLNVLPVYAMGFNGSGVRVSVLDDGIEHNHTDLQANYDPEISWDCNDQDPDPTPRYEVRMKNSHGTRCAGEIAMTANNVKCGVGVAWGAKVGGVRMLDGRITDRIEGEAIGYAWDKVDIYSASWGPIDDGGTVEGPGRLAIEAFKRGITKGRGGKGVIYVWANGNGGGNNDNCNCDGYSSSIYTISIGSASQHGLFPWYGEICSSTLAVAYSSGAYQDQKIATTDTRDSCTLAHTGTSAAAPLAAGIIALALNANPNLTWRDVQHLIVWTSEYGPLSANLGWQINGAGLRFDVRFGFGLMNAGALVIAALNWTTVPEKHTCNIYTTPSTGSEARIKSREPVTVLITVEDCIVNYIEHVEVIVNVQYTRRGALEIYLVSPQGTKVQLLSIRPKDKSNVGFVNWPMTSVATWGERSNGLWRLIIQDETDEENIGTVGRIGLFIHGTDAMPAHMENGPRKYNGDYYYQEDFDYYKNVDKEDFDLASDDNNIGDILGAHDVEDMFDNANPTLLSDVKEELQRIHHSKNGLRSFGRL